MEAMAWDKQGTPAQLAEKAGDQVEEKTRRPSYGLEGLVIDAMKESNIQARKQQMITRMVWEMKTRPDAYVIFNTLTIRGEYEGTVFDKGSYAWQSYLAKFHYKLYGTAKRPEGSTYAAVVEKGGKTGRLHIHVLHIVDKCPGDDPNKGSMAPTRREIEALKGCWEYGWSSPIAVRTDPRDAYARAGWLWPLMRSKGGRWKPIKGSMTAVATYVGKYVAKAYGTQHKKGRETWRTRVSRGLGLRPMTKALETLESSLLAEMVTREIPRILIHQRRLPAGTLKVKAARELLRRNPSLLQRATVLVPAESLIEKVRNHWTRSRTTFRTPRSGPSNGEESSLTENALSALETLFGKPEGRQGITAGACKGYR